MQRIIPISELQSKTREVVEGVKSSRDPVIITQRGRPAVLVVDYEEYEGMLHTLDEMSYPDWQEKLKEAEEDSRKGRGVSLKTLKQKISLQRRKSGGGRQVSSEG